MARFGKFVARELAPRKIAKFFNLSVDTFLIVSLNSLPIKKITMKTHILFLALLPAMASASEFSYKNFSVVYLDGSAELPGYVADFLGSDKDLDVEGVQIDGQFDFTNNFFGFASYQDGEINLNHIGTLDESAFTAGLGGSASFCEQADLQYGVGYRHSEWDAGNRLKQDIGHVTANIGVRWSPVEWLEINPSITHYFPANDDDFLKAVQGTYLDAKIYFTRIEMFQPFIGVTYNLQEDSDNLTGNLELFQAGLRVSF